MTGDITTEGLLKVWEEVAKPAPIATALVAVVAAMIAWFAIRAQREIARRRAASTFFSRRKWMTKCWKQAYSKSREGFALLRAGARLDQFMTTENYRHVRKYLNVHELMASGIYNHVLGERTCFSFWAHQLVKDCRAASTLIELIRLTPNEGTAYTYHGLEALVSRWWSEIDEITRRHQRTVALTPPRLGRAR
jgi:hypothetical protein